MAVQQRRWRQPYTEKKHKGDVAVGTGRPSKNCVSPGICPTILGDGARPWATLHIMIVSRSR